MISVPALPPARIEGAGLGATGSAVTARGGVGIRNFENGLLEVFYLFGWPGGFCFFLGMFGIVLQGLRLADARFDQFANATRSAAAGSRAAWCAGGPCS